MYISCNANPDRLRVGDCTMRAISKALGKTWDEVYTHLAAEGFAKRDIPIANHVWGAYLKRNGYRRHLIPDECPDCYTVADFAADNPEGVYILAISGHVVCVIDGDWYDTWDSGAEVPIYYWKKESDE